MAQVYEETARADVRDMVRGAAMEDLLMMAEEIGMEISRRSARVKELGE